MPRTQEPNINAMPQHYPLSRWRWLVYLSTGIIIFILIFLKVGAGSPDQYATLGAWLEPSAMGAICVSGIFTGLIVALLKIFLDPVFLGVAQRKSKLLIAEELVVSVAETAIGVALVGTLSAAASSASGSESGELTGGGGSFSGGGSSGSY